MKYPEFVGLKLPTSLVKEARQQAEADDRSLSAFLRRIIIQAIERNKPARDVEADRD